MFEGLLSGNVGEFDVGNPNPLEDGGFNGVGLKLLGLVKGLMFVGDAPNPFEDGGFDGVEPLLLGPGNECMFVGGGPNPFGDVALGAEKGGILPGGGPNCCELGFEN